MPLVEVTLVEGRSEHALRTLISELTQVTSATLSADLASIRVIVREVPATRWASGDVTIAERSQTAGSTGSSGQ